LILIVLIGVLISSLIRGVFGFGGVLVGMPFILLFLPVVEANFTVSLYGCIMGVIMSLQSWQNLRRIGLQERLLALSASFLGILTGIFAKFLNGCSWRPSENSLFGLNSR
jgi:hypothetical protein